MIALLLAVVLAITPLTGHLHGTASWYRYFPGGAAAGPHLRAVLGLHWRGTKVKVCNQYRCVVVRLTDWCYCYRNLPGERLIDLDVRSFALLASPSRGLTKVWVVLP